VILTDNPWRFGSRRATRKDNPSKKTRLGYGAKGNYDNGDMSTPEIANLAPLIQAVATPDAYCFMWVSEAMPTDHLQILDTWGFSPVCTAFVWVKLNPISGTPVFNPGKYTGTNIERCILARRNRKKYPCWHSTAKGEPKPSQVILAHRDRQDGTVIHSRKPPDAHERIESWLTPYLQGHGMLELFARQPRPGWITIGGDLSGRDIREDLADLAAGKILPSAPAKKVGQRGLFDEEESA